MYFIESMLIKLLRYRLKRRWDKIWDDSSKEHESKRLSFVMDGMAQADMYVKVIRREKCA